MVEQCRWVWSTAKSRKQWEMSVKLLKKKVSIDIDK